MSVKWDRRFMEVAAQVATWSKDPSSKVGAVVVGANKAILTTGYNGPPRGVNDDIPERWERPLKYKIVAHAEANAIYNAARKGVALEGATIYVSTLPPCTTCAQAIIQCGIRRVVVQTVDVPDRWKDDLAEATEMLAEAGVQMGVLTEDCRDE